VSWGWQMGEEAIAHVRDSDKAQQALSDHLLGVAAKAQKYASVIGLESMGELLGLLHDLGKYSKAFQDYLKSGTGIFNQDEDYVDAKNLKGKIDHSTAGAQYVLQRLAGMGSQVACMAEMLAHCLVSHHSGLIDGLDPSGETVTLRRFQKADEKTYLKEVCDSIDSLIQVRVDALLSDSGLFDSFLKTTNALGVGVRNSSQLKFAFALLDRFLFSCLIDADRVDTANFEKPIEAGFRAQNEDLDWKDPIGRLEKKYASFLIRGKVDEIRAQVAGQCLKAADRPLGLYTLTVPTGGGKTLASLRFALSHAQKHGLERVIYVIPFTSIIDQNAQEIREIMESAEFGPAQPGKLVLEHHSNLTPDEESWQQKVLSQNWDAPIVFTTNVQVLEAMFGAGTRNARRFHQLSKAVVIFDEAQAIPINCVHLFNNTINFLVAHCRSTVVMCTATQPLLHRVSETRGKLAKQENSELIEDVGALFRDLKRVEVLDCQKPGGHSNNEIAHVLIKELEKAGSVLLIANTKTMAKDLYQIVATQVPPDTEVFHLSTNMCPMHRMEKLSQIRQRLDDDVPTVCISTQLIEAGVDVDFGAVIRLTAGLDSIAQAAGRCNRNGLRPTGRVLILNPSEEKLGSLVDIQIGIEKTGRVLRDLLTDSALAGCDLLSPTVMERFYSYYFYDRKEEMVYQVGPKSEVGRNDSLLELLSENNLSVSEYKRAHNGAWPTMYFRQAFMTAARCFKAIDSPTQGVIVPFGDEGQRIISELFASESPETQFGLLKQAQRYSVNVYQNMIDRLWKADAIKEISGAGILTLDERFYSEAFGLSEEPETLLSVQLA